MKIRVFAPYWKIFLVSFVVLTSCLQQAAALNIYCLPVGDGFFHNESGSSYDYFDSTSNQVIVNRYFDGFSDSIQDRTGFLQFSMASLDSNDVISSATLYVYLEASHYADESPSAGFINHVAPNAAANGNASQRLSGNQLVVEIKDQPVGWLALDVTSYLQADQAANVGYACFSLNMNTAGYFDNAGFRITSADAGTNTPYLSVAVPESGSYGLVMGWFAVAYLLGRRQPEPIGSLPKDG
jgi:hypothetical protein